MCAVQLEDGVSRATKSCQTHSVHNAHMLLCCLNRKNLVGGAVRVGFDVGGAWSRLTQTRDCSSQRTMTCSGLKRMFVCAVCSDQSMRVLDWQARVGIPNGGPSKTFSS